MDPPAPPDLHAQRAARSASLLDRARKLATKEREYDSESTREDIKRLSTEAFGGKVPYEWQVDVAEALWLGLDTAVIAGTGAGKTMPFVMPLFLDTTKKKMVIVISPLNELEKDQARRFVAMGLKATAVNGEVYSKQLHKELTAKEYRVLLTSPEMVLEHEQFSALVRSPDFMRDVLYLVIDEAHCVSQWGDKFRKMYAELCKMRSLLGLRKPFLLTSATLPPFMLKEVFLKLEFVDATTYFINLGNNRANIAPIVHRLKAAASSLPIIDFLVRGTPEGGKFPRAIVFFNKREQAQVASRHLKQKVSEAMASQINFLHAGRGQRARRRTMREFRDGTVNILCATEAAGMGMDIQDIELGVQFLAASSLSVWTQRAGRAGRSGQQAFAVLLIEQGILEEKKAKLAVKQEGGKKKTGTSSRTTKPQSNSSAPAGKTKGRKRKITDVTQENQPSVVKAEPVEVRVVAEGLSSAVPTSEPAPSACPVPSMEGDSAVPSDSTGPGDTPVVVEYKKKAEDGMRTWAGTTHCRRAVADAYFDNPPRPAGRIIYQRHDCYANHHMTGNSDNRYTCCDNCVKAKQLRSEVLSDADQQLLHLVDSIAGGCDVGSTELDEDDEVDGLVSLQDPSETALVPAEPPPSTQARQPRGLGPRRDKHLEACRARLRTWRNECRRRDYRYCAFSPAAILPDSVLTHLATHARLKTAADVTTALPNWTFASKHAAEVVSVLAEVDARFRAEREAEQQAAKENRAKRTAENKEQRDEERRVKRRLEGEQRRQAEAAAQAEVAYRQAYAAQAAQYAAYYGYYPGQYVAPYYAHPMYAAPPPGSSSGPSINS
ncbi:P-loop containing nucleoside triphosphate hydrolase protein [Cerioporus squamosus]|nr:P-loop containing nucleoside triphosphate hydrolase protein [Cerioporus squamosus]